MVAPSEELTLVVDPHLDAQRRGARPAQALGPLGRGQGVVLGPAPVHGQQRRGLGQAVDLDELPAQLGLHPLDGPGRWRRPGDHDAGAPGTGDGAVPLGGGVEDGGHDRRGAVELGDTVGLDAAQDLGPVDLADDDLGATHARVGVGHAPAVAVEHREGVQVDVPIGHARLPTERGGVEPDVAMGELDALGSGGGPARVVDRGRRVLVGRPRSGLGGGREEGLVAVVTDDEPVGRGDARQVLRQLGVHDQDRRPAVLDDVADLGRVEPEVDRHQDPARAADPVEGREQAGGVVRHHRHPLPHPDPEGVERGGLGASPLGHLAVGQRAPGGRRLIGLVDDPDPVAVDQLGPVQEVVDRQGHLHRGTPPVAARST